MACLIVYSLIVTQGGYVYGNEDSLSNSMAISDHNNRQESVSQKRIDHLNDETQAMLDEYRQTDRELNALTIYNNQLERILGSQKKELTSMQKQLDDIEVTQREIVPLILQMLAWLEAFVEIDHPFLPKERQQRVTLMRTLLDRADVSTGEKYRRLLEAYQIEMDYARTIEAYSGELSDTKGSRRVEFLRLGRIELYYLTLDQTESGWWDAVHGRWLRLSDHFNQPIRYGLRLARKQAAPNLLHLPIHAPKEPMP